MDTPHLLELRSLHYQYRNKYQTVDAVRSATAAFDPGTLAAIVGTSGSGKSTLLAMLAGLTLPTSGDLLFRGESVSRMDIDRYRRECAAVIYQSFRLFPLLTAVENVSYPMELRGMTPRAARPLALELLDRVRLPESFARRYPSMLSGGEQQRVAIARSLAMNTPLLLADEPTGNLDTANTTLIIDILSSLAHHDHYCVILVTHDLSLLPSCDRVLRMNDGLLTEE